jgi:DNA-binding PadR family transcriptional regulator
MTRHISKSPLIIDILAALAAGELSGYAVAQQVMNDINYSRQVYNWSVYRELSRLIDAGLVEIAEKDEEAVRYRLTPRGRTTLMVERARVQTLLGILRQRL